MHATKKTEVPHDGNNSCLTCYGAEDTAGQCCNTCDEVGGSGGGANCTVLGFGVNKMEVPREGDTSCLTCYGAEDTAGECCNTCDKVGRSEGR